LPPEVKKINNFYTNCLSTYPKFYRNRKGSSTQVLVRSIKSFFSAPKIIKLEVNNASNFDSPSDGKFFKINIMRINN